MWGGLQVDLSSLATVGGNFHILESTVQTLDLPSLVSVGGDFILRQCPALETVSAPLLATAHEIMVQNNPLLTTATLPSFASAAYMFYFYDNALLDTVTVTPATFVNIGDSNNLLLLFVDNPSYLDTAAQTIYNDLVGHGFHGTFEHHGNLV